MAKKSGFVFPPAKTHFLGFFNLESGWGGMGSYGHKHWGQVSGTPWLGSQQATVLTWKVGKLGLPSGSASRVLNPNIMLLRSMLYTRYCKTQKMEEGKCPQPPLVVGIRS